MKKIKKKEICARCIFFRIDKDWCEGPVFPDGTPIGRGYAREFMMCSCPSLAIDEITGDKEPVPCEEVKHLCKQMGHFREGEE